MCNMAAYAGKLPAAPFLLDMIRCQEYLAGGHYTGIATIDGTTIHMYKVVGTVDDLLRRYPEIYDMPGNTGIIHSRTPGFDGDAWAQPFFSGDRKIIYCANGVMGIFDGKTSYKEFYSKSKNSGTIYLTARKADSNAPGGMDDGFCIHSSEIMANAVADRHNKGFTLSEAMHNSAVDFKAEIAALALSVAEPDSVTAFRVNQPLVWGRNENGFYLATSAFALDELGVNWINPAPFASVMTMTKDFIKILPMDEFSEYFEVSVPLEKIYGNLNAALDNEAGLTVLEMSKIVRNCWCTEKLVSHYQVVYDFLRENLRNGKVEYIDSTEPASGAGLFAPVRRFKIAKRYS